ncbi:unnamed protein product [Chondrus crispus]|uniref:Uncharacterized protein n=1 Tax=Chondrus crispus TaxID=2769 RepID=R7QE27_CHOCR|nr:unnamed protein product [Chondrus crispus]CDF36339.1 unnamed protein product [Chondrus crispus]|eukprot:XP_005716158.1 unnamed protein product [Chondrus crispus]
MYYTAIRSSSPTSACSRFFRRSCACSGSLFVRRSSDTDRHSASRVDFSQRKQNFPLSLLVDIRRYSAIRQDKPPSFSSKG